MHTADLLLMMNFVNTQPALKASESWTPLCLPSFNSTGFLYSYVSYVSDDLCLLLVTANNSPDGFHYCKTAKDRIVEDLEQVLLQYHGIMMALC